MEKRTLGDTTTVNFTQFNRGVEAKVDTGADTSSLHATNIQTNGGKVSFVSPSISQNAITVDLAGQHEVHSADGGGNTRPLVKFDIEIDGVQLQGMEFNLNDRSNMDSEILLGQNVLKAGNFVVDVSQGGEEDYDTSSIDAQPVDNRERIREAIEVLRKSNVTLAEIMMYIQTEAVQKIQA